MSKFLKLMLIEQYRIAFFELEQRLILSYSPYDIREILVQLVDLDKSNKYSKQLWKISNSWVIPIPLQSVISLIPSGFFKDFSYILIAKSKELALSKDFVGSKSLLHAVENELQRQNGNNSKLLKLLCWELLLVEICHCLYVWPASDICKYKTQFA